MNSNVCVVTIMFLSLGNVAGLICLSGGPKKPSHQQQPSTGSLQIATVNIPPQKWGKGIRFTIKVEEFDNNTEIYCENSKEKTERPVKNPKIVNAKINSILEFDSNNEPYKNLIKIEGNETWENIKEPEPTIIYYNENKNVPFSCLEPSNTTYIQLGIINTTSNMLTTFDSTHKILNITHNGTILCCVYYEVNETAEEMWITRVVANKTLLHYYSNTVRRDSLEGTEIIYNTTTTDTDSPADQGHHTIIITIAVALVFILLVIFVTSKKRFRKKPQSEAKVLYADLDFLRQIQPDSLPRPGPAEESPYVQIIGEMRTQTK